MQFSLPIISLSLSFCSSEMIRRMLWSFTQTHHTSSISGRRKCCKPQRTRGKRRDARRCVWVWVEEKYLISFSVYLQLLLPLLIIIITSHTHTQRQFHLYNLLFTMYQFHPFGLHLLCKITTINSSLHVSGDCIKPVSYIWDETHMLRRWFFRNAHFSLVHVIHWSV